MTYSGDAAEQVVRMTLQGVEVAAKITGSAAKETALLIIAALKNNNKDKLKLKGKARLASMLKSGKALEIISVKERDLAKFAEGAKEYGIVYCVLRNTKSGPDGLCDVMVKADDSAKISRLAQRFNFATVDKAKLESEIIADMGAKAPEANSPEAKGESPKPPEVADTEKLIDDILGSPEGKAEPDEPELEKAEAAKTKGATPESHPLAQGGQERGKSNLYEPTSEPRRKPEKTTSSKPSVREEIREIKAERKKADTVKREEQERGDKKKPQKSHKHKQPKQKSKSKKMKGHR